jgi:hypothetical protein
MQKEIITKFIQSMIVLLESAKDFAVEQIPQVAREIIHYTIATDSVAMALSILGYVGLYKLYAYINKQALEAKKASIYNWLDIYGWHFVTGILFIVITVFFKESLFELLKATFAPRMFLIEYLYNLVNHGVNK